MFLALHGDKSMVPAPYLAVQSSHSCFKDKNLKRGVTEELCKKSVIQPQQER